MEKVMKLIAVSPKKQRTITRQDGSTKVIEYYEIEANDGIDTIFGESSESLTSLISATDEKVKVNLLEGHLYNIRFNINSRHWEKDGRKGVMTSITLHQMYHLT